MTSDDPSAVAIQAAFYGNLRLLKKMARKMDLREAKDSNGGNVLHFAAARGHLEICMFLVEESGLDVNCTSPDCETPVAVAATGGKMSILRYLLDHGGDPGMPDAMGDTPLHDAADRGHEEAVRLLLSKGVDVDPLNNRRLTPLHMAAGKGHDQAVKVLLEHGADPNRVAHNMFAPLIMACTAGSLKCLKLLVEAGADVNFKSPYGPSLLMKAVIVGSTDILKFLLEAGADPDISDEFGENPIMQAARNGRHDLVEILFPQTKPITSLPNWTVDGIITTMKYMPFKLKGEDLTKEHILAHLKPLGNEAFAKGDYLGATYFYGLGAANAFVEALNLDPANDEIKTALREAIKAMGCTSRSKEQIP